MLAQPLAKPLSLPFSSKLAIAADNVDEQPSYRPACDIEAFNSLLPPPIRFVEASSSSTLAGLETKYTPINVPFQNQPQHSAQKSLIKKAPDQDASCPPVSVSTSAKPGKHASELDSKSPANGISKGAKSSPARSLHPYPIDTTWLPACNLASGLYNTGNSCFLNSALQILLHTPPLLRIVLSHSKNECRPKLNWCMVCSLRDTAIKAYGNKNAFMPYDISNRLQTIAKHMRKGRQEDSHEFLRYAIDALQKSCLAGLPPKVDPKLAETSWVHKIFGGQLRSRVTCGSCGYNSDTYDSILDLSLDILNSNSLKEALRKFVAVDKLKGADKYKCEKCKKPVVAEKQFTVHEAPVVLTVHLKRFSPFGKKIGHHVLYDESLSLRPVMSEGQYGPSYSLYGVVCHAGGGPNSGHYYAYVRSREGRWYEMNDESVTPCRPPVGAKNAYMLFYLRNKGEGLEAVVGSAKSTKSGDNLSSHVQSKGASVVSGMKKRAVSSGDGMEVDDEDTGEKISNKPFIGPLLPSLMTNGDTSPMKPIPDASPSNDPQATKVKQKIEETKRPKTLQGVMGYGSDDSNDNQQHAPSSPAPQLPPPSSPPAPSSPLASTSKGSTSQASQPSTIPANSFYSPTPEEPLRKNKRKSPPDSAPVDTDDRSMSELKRYAQARIPLDDKRPRTLQQLSAANPYNRIHIGRTYGKQRRVARGI